MNTRELRHVFSNAAMLLGLAGVLALLAMGGGLLFSLACLTAALGPANATETHPVPAHVTADRPALL